MAPPAKKPIRLTFLWADERAVVEDFRAGYSQTLVDWASAFYGRYGFELDVKPAPGGSAQDAYRYCLRKTDGFEPDHTSAKEFAKRMLARKASTLRAWIQADHDISELAPKEAAKYQELGAAILQLLSVPPAGLPAQINKVSTLFAEHQALADALAEKRKLYAQLDAKLDFINAQFAKEKEARDLDTAVRLQIAERIKSADPKLGIADPYRLKIFFCRMKLSPGVLTLRPSPQPHGFTLGKIDVNSVNGQYLFDGALIMVNLLRPDEPITLAHEIVHAAGRGHIFEATAIKKIPDWFREIKTDPKTGDVVLPSLYEKVHDDEAGYYDGPKDDIVNYNSMGKKPDEVTLYDEDLLKIAFFVKPPPPPPKKP